MTWIAEAAAAVRERAVLDELYGRLEPYAHRIAQLGFAACLGSVERVLGLVAARGRTAVAHGHLHRALARNTRLAARALVVRTQADLAELLAVTGGEDAWELGTAALAGARELGMDGLVERLEVLLGPGERRRVQGEG